MSAPTRQTTGQSGYLSPDLSKKVGDALAIAQQHGISIGPLAPYLPLFRNGLAFGNPFELFDKGTGWRDLANQQAIDSLNDVSCASSDTQSWQGDAAQAFGTYVGKVNKAIPGLQAEFKQLSDGLNAAGFAEYSFFGFSVAFAVAVAGAIATLAFSETGPADIAAAVVALAGAVVALLTSIGTITSVVTAMNDFNDAGTTHFLGMTSDGNFPVPASPL